MRGKLTFDCEHLHCLMLYHVLLYPYQTDFKIFSAEHSPTYMVIKLGMLVILLKTCILLQLVLCI